MNITVPRIERDFRTKNTKYSMHYQPELKEDKGFGVIAGPFPSTTKDTKILDLFLPYGPVLNYVRPNLLTKPLKHSPQIFIYYENEEDADKAIFGLHETNHFFNQISVIRKEESQSNYFSGETGFLTNFTLPNREEIEEEFDSSMPREHYICKKREQYKNFDDLHTVKVQNLGEKITKDLLEELFSNFGTVINIYLPVELNNKCKPKGFAFVRYRTLDEANQAIQQANGLEFYPNQHLIVTLSQPKTYFSLDESFPNPKNRRH